MKTKKLLKALGVVLAAVALVVVSVLGTMAWLTSTSDEVVNTITVGNVTIELNEPHAPVNKQFLLIPGKTYDKDPTVTVGATSQPCYVRMMVTVSNAEAWDGAFTTTGITANEGWTLANTTEDDVADTVTYEYRYNTVMNASGTATLFDELTIPSTWNNTTLTSDGTVTIVAHAIQSEGFEADVEHDLTAADVAWAAFDTQNP